MTEVFRFLIAVISTAAFVCLCFFVVQMNMRGQVVWLYDKLHFFRSSTYATADRKFVETLYCVLALIGLLSCIAAGTYHMLWWLPRHWGGFDEDGQWTSTRFILAIWSTVCVGYFVVVALLDGIRSKVEEVWLREDLRISRIEIEGYRSLVECGDSVFLLEGVARRSGLALQELKSETHHASARMKCAAHERYRNYSSLIGIYTTLNTLAKSKLDKLQALEGAQKRP